MIKTRKQMFIVIASFVLVILLGTTTYAFFNYTRTGTANTIKTGRIAFNSSQSSGNSEAINLTNVFPISRNDLGNDVDNSAEVVIDIEGDTTYSDGLEYLVTFEDVNIKTSTNKKIPIGISITPEKTGELGTSNDDYFDEGERGGSTSYYKVLASNVLKDGDYVLVGYIRPGVAEINGQIGIKAFIDKDQILISDTYDGSESDNMGTPNSMATGKVVLTTEEWNSLQGNNSISFKVRIQANEGIWVGNPTSRNDMLNMYSMNTFTSEEKSAITEINFIRMSEEMIDIHANVKDLTPEGGQGVVKGWVENNKLYIASPGITYFPIDSSNLMSAFTNVININFNNINTSEVTNMDGMFGRCSSLTNIDLSSFDTSNVTSMLAMFGICSSLTNIDLSYLNTNSITNMNAIFNNCTSLISVNLDNLGSDNLTGSVGAMFSNSGIQEISMRNFNFGTTDLGGLFTTSSNIVTVDISNANTSRVTSFSGMFSGAQRLQKINMDGIDFGSNSLSNLFWYMSNLQEISLKNVNTSNVTDMTALFAYSDSITKLDLSDFDTRSVNNMTAMFWNCTSLEEINLSSFDTSNVTNMVNMFAMGTYSNSTWTPSNNTLTKIYVGSGWNINSVINSTNMFYNNTHLVGGQGTSFDENNPTDKTYALVDGGQSNPGYLTLKTN